MRIKIEKLTSNLKTAHPNNIEKGYTKEGKFVAEPKVGEPFWVGNGFRTSLVQEIIDANTFRTTNSIYKWEEVK